MRVLNFSNSDLNAVAFCHITVIMMRYVITYMSRVEKKYENF